MKWGKKQEAKWAKQREAREEGLAANLREDMGWVKDRKTGEWYDPKVKFREIMNSPEAVAVMKRLKER
jgi:hypothetical protein